MNAKQEFFGRMCVVKIGRQKEVAGEDYARSQKEDIRESAEEYARGKLNEIVDNLSMEYDREGAWELILKIIKEEK